MLVKRQPCVYVLANKEHGTLYVGVTSDLIKRVREHKDDVVEGFTRKYRIHDLVWFEQHETMESAIRREKAIKEWRRAWKTELIEATNPSGAICITSCLGEQSKWIPACAGMTTNND